MNEQQYQLLTQSCDQILLATDSTVERIAISWLHVVREHPVFLGNYLDLFETKTSFNDAALALKRKIKSVAGRLRQYLRSRLTNGQLWYGQGLPSCGIDVLFVSHLINASHAGAIDDFYFGGIPNELISLGKSCVIALINQTGYTSHSLAAKWAGAPVPRVIFSNSLGHQDELQLRRRLKQEAAQLSSQAKEMNPSFLRYAMLRASKEAASSRTLSTLRLGQQIGTLVAVLQPKAVVVTHEGHAWERVAFATARSASPDVRCIGYQHAALLKLQHSLRRNLGQQYNPDHILTAGAVTQVQLARAPGLRGIPVTILGSNRGLAGSHIEIQSAGRQQRRSPKGKPACLVIPEGIASECHILFNFALACARVMTQIHFVWRMHPILSFETIAAKNHNLRHLPANVEISRAPIDRDMERCRWALYRGTSAVIQAVPAGLRPIYLKLADELSIDPLYELNTFRVTIESPEDFLLVINRDLDDDRNSFTKEFKVAYDYCIRYFLPWDVTALENAISFAP